MAMRLKGLGELRATMKGGSTIPFTEEDMGVSNISVRVFDEDVVQTNKNLGAVAKCISYTMARAVGYIAVDLLAKAQPRVPVDTGDLRKSGRASIFLGWGGRTGYALDIGRGNQGGRGLGPIERNLNKITRKRIERGRRAITSANAIVGYSREGELHGEPIDVALWAHEYLRPHSERSEEGTPGQYYARVSGTGPKYLELPWLENLKTYTSILKQAARSDCLVNLRKITTRIRKKDREIVILHANKLDSLGYY